MNSSDKGFDFWAEYNVVSKEDVSLVAGAKSRFSEVNDIHARLELLSQCRAFDFTNDAKGKYQSVILSGQYNNYASSRIELMQHIGLIPEILQNQINNLPFGSFSLRLSFTLDKSWYSKDDTSFCVFSASMLE